MKKELDIILTSILFFTRIPVKLIGEYSNEKLNKASKYLPLIGFIIGGIASGVFFISNFYFPVSISIIFSMIASILATGAFHEDGLADTFDAFGGGWTKEQKLTIMKDSRIGTYGSIALVLVLLFKYILLSEYSSKNIVAIIFLSHVLSRITPVVIIYFLKYVRFDDSSKSKPVGVGINIYQLIFALVFGIFPLIFFSLKSLIIIPILIVSQILLSFWYKKHLGGYTGDSLGASQQITEIIILLSFLILWS